MRGIASLLSVGFVFLAGSIAAAGAPSTMNGTVWSVRLTNQPSGTIAFTKTGGNETGTYQYTYANNTYNGTYELDKTTLLGKHTVDAKTQVKFNAKAQSASEFTGKWVTYKYKKEGKKGKWVLDHKNALRLTKTTGPQPQPVPVGDVDFRLGSPSGSTLHGNATIVQNVGTTFVISVLIKMPDDNGSSTDLTDTLGAYSITIQYDQTRLKITGIGAGNSALGAPLAANEKSPGTYVFNDINADANGNPSPTATGLVEVARITFQVRSDAPAGAAEIHGKLNVLQNANVSQQNPTGQKVGTMAGSGNDVFGSGVITVQ